MVQRMQYNKSWLRRKSLPEIGRYEHKVTSKYKPHQGTKEKNRRLKQLMNNSNATFVYKV